MISFILSFLACACAHLHALSWQKPQVVCKNPLKNMYPELDIVWVGYFLTFQKQNKTKQLGQSIHDFIIPGITKPRCLKLDQGMIVQYYSKILWIYSKMSLSSKYYPSSSWSRWDLWVESIRYKTSSCSDHFQSSDDFWKILGLGIT